MSQAASKAQANGVGTVISIGGVTGATGTETFVPIGELTDAKFSGIKVAVTDVSTFAANTKRKLGTMVDYGTFSATVLRVSNDAGQAAVIAAAASAALYDFKVQLEPNEAAGQTTTGDLITFSGVITEAGGFDLSLTKQADGTLSIDIDGAWSVTEGA
jgi:hypothetical protein